MTADTPEKFLFDTDFGSMDEPQTAPGSAEPEAETEADEAAEDIQEEAPPPTFSEEDLTRARDEGFQAGRDEATRDMASAMEQRQADTLEAINTQMASFFEAYNSNTKEHNRDAVAVATAIMRKLFPSLNMDNALIEIEHMIAEAMKRTSGAPALIVRVAPDLKANIEAKAQELAALRGHEGTITVMADETLDAGDAKVEWDGGAMVRDTQTMWNDIDEIIERNLGDQNLGDQNLGDQNLGEPTDDVSEDSEPAKNEH